ncbi:MAG: threonine synthase [Spirochaetes bacterium]|nr:threonine synthase [Spirochaetota bacterium]
MQFTSTRDPNLRVSFREAVFQGLAPDGGLYHPIETPDLRDLFLSFAPSQSFADLAESILPRLFPEEISPSVAKRIAQRAFPFSPALRRILPEGDRKIQILELFHGPSCAFKDFGASFLAAVMEEFLKDEASHAVILTATSGDTGSAVARAFYKREHIDVVILYPSQRVSPLQEKQLTTLGGNIHALEVKGSFDDCQRMVKEAFVDPELIRKIRLTSANSINIGRLIPQAFYYIWAYANLSPTEQEACIFCVPSGNFGNLTAGVLAWKWGLPVQRFIAATNINKVVPEYLQNGIYKPRSSVQTLSNAMDVGNPSNFERLSRIFHGNHAEMHRWIEGIWVTDNETLHTIRTYYATEGIFLDPHTALGVRASERYLTEGYTPKPNCIVSLGTAHPGKFLEIVEEATGKRPPLPAQLQAVLELPKQAVMIGNSSEELKRFLMKRF